MDSEGQKAARDFVDGELKPGRFQHRPCNRVVEVAPFDDVGGDQYRVKSETGKQYILPKLLADLLLLLDGRHTIEEVATVLKRTTGIHVAPVEVEDAINREFLPRQLIRSAPEAGRAQERKRRRTTLDFVLRFPLVSRRRVEPIARRLTILLSTGAVIPSLFLIVLVHLRFYSQHLPEQGFLNTPQSICLTYLLALATVCIHELGHAAASSRFGCEYGEIGFCLYLIFPALYVDLSQSWSLPRRQRAVIDMGGIYFQLLTTILLYALYLLTAKPCFAGAIRLVDIMVFWAINPLVKFDGYWLLVDSSGLVNLQSRSLALLKDAVLWPIRRRLPTLSRIKLRAPARALLCGYSSIIGAGILASAVYMFTYAPEKLHEVIESVRYLPSVVLHSASRSLLDLLQLATAILFFVFVYQFLHQIVLSIIAKKQQGRKLAFRQLPQAASETDRNLEMNSLQSS